MAPSLARSPRRDRETFPASRWITLGQACNLLGVNESTLRRWADAGHVQSFRTPGGHRRFSEDDLRALMDGQTPQEQTPYSSLSQLAVTRIRRRLQRGKGPTTHWYTSIGEENRERLRPLGRRLTSLMSEYLAKGSRRSRLLAEAREIGHQYGQELMSDNLSLRDGLEAFIFFRKSLDDAAIELAQRSSLSAEQAVEMWELLSGLADQVLLAITEAYGEPVGAAKRPFT